MFTLRKSIHGRQFGLSSTGGLVTSFGSTGSHNSTALNSAAQMWGSGLMGTVTAAAAVIPNAGITLIGSGTTNDSTMAIAAPADGVYKEIHFACSATAFTLGTSATTVTILTSTRAQAAGSSAAGSTAVSVNSAVATGTGGTITMRGMGSTIWKIVTATANLAIST